MIRRPPRSTQSRSSAASDVYKRQITNTLNTAAFTVTKVYSPASATAAATFSLTCANGTVANSPQNLTGGGSVTFNVSGDTPPDSCTATETSVPAGYTSDSPCAGTITGAPVGSGSCTITNTLIPTCSLTL